MLVKLISVLLILIADSSGIYGEYFLMGILNGIVIVYIWINSLGKKEAN